MRLKLLLMVVASVALAQAPPATSSIEGVVIRSDNGQPIPGAMVTLSSANFPIRTRGTATLTGGRFVVARAQGSAVPVAADANGRFLFSNLKAGTYWLSATASGFVLPREGKPLFLRDGDILRNSAIQLIAESTLSGRVFDEKGRPASGAEVTAFRSVYTESGKGYRLVQQATTDDQGRYRLFGLPPGRYYLGAGTFNSPTERRDPRVQNGTIYSVAFYPRAETLDTASVVEARLGREDSYDITVQRLPGLHVVRGRIIDAETGNPPQQVDSLLFSTTFFTGTGRGLTPTYDPQTGAFEIQNIAPGTFDLEFGIPQVSTTTPFGTAEQRTAWEREGASRRFAFKHIRVADADLEGLVFTLSTVHSVPGRFVLDGQPDSPIPNIEKASLSVGLQGLDTNPSAFVSAPATDGTFAIEGLREGEFDVKVSGVPDGLYLKSIQYDGADIVGKPLKYSDPMKGVVEVVLRRGAVSILGTVKDARTQVVSGAQVVLLAVQRGRSRDLTTIADQSGRFSLHNVPPGEYRLYAWDSVDEGAYYDPEFLKTYQDQGQIVRAVEGANQQVDVRLSDSPLSR
jgi:hypothetical protein